MEDTVHVNRLKLVSARPNEIVFAETKTNVVKRRGRPRKGTKVEGIPKRKVGRPRLFKQPAVIIPKRRGRKPKQQQPQPDTIPNASNSDTNVQTPIMMETNTILSLYYLLIIFAPSTSIKISICDCTKPVTRGLLDLTDPEYCFKLHNAKEDGYKSMSKPVNYKVVTTMDTVLKLQELVCSQWIETKRITGSFWIGSYDTEHFHTTKAVDPKECWDMKLQLNCAGNRNVVNGKTYSYIQKPNGQGKWMSISEYSVVNCLAQDIELRQENKDGPILSPFGAHNVSLEAEKLFINHNTLVWHKPNHGYSANNYNVKKYFPPILLKRTRTKRQTKATNTGDHSLSLAWGHINSLTFFPPTEFDKKFENKDYVVTTSAVENPLFLMPRVPPFDASRWHELGIWPDTQQQFDYSPDQSISFVFNKTRYYLTVNKPDYLLFKDCSKSFSTWIYDAYRMYFMEAETKGCLTAVKDKVDLLPCEMEPHSIRQMWKFEFKNLDETFSRTYPNITIEEWEFVQEELQSRPAESDTEIEDLFNWGSFMQKTKRKENKMNSTCLTHARNMRTITLERCTKQDADFFKQNQMFEYATDYTIRKFTSNMCLHIDHFLYDSLPSLMPCNKNSMRWGINEVTGQFMELHSLRCIENNKGRLYLGRCNDDQKPRSQKWKFEYHSPMLVNSTDSPRLTPSVMLEWHRNLSIYAIPFPPLPPIIQRANTIEPPIDEEDNTTTTPTSTTSQLACLYW
ncbi:hypothetical protein DAPPUDRAFT_121776 [Daphnia pulex]|uniref:Ricin B lectin domain-containing protein n=1 Tax=Daphnia pulex TaxID=6669 RepID=E9I3F7_DAPPU|nr:hypothetical protein DAPPUDRAFT_121776 [Daphnia pulex]|eukprot:EFX61473.1 hypothetical protein DAPPUDRAFT_121776 [Daphnia pulex]